MPHKITGGGKMTAYLSGLARKIGRGGVVNVGFLENAKYTDDSASRKTRFLQGVENLKAAKEGRAPTKVEPAKASGPQNLPVAQVAFWNNFGTTRAPARPFFSNMVRDESPTWGSKLGAAVKANGYDSTAALGAVGTDMKDALVEKIQTWPADNAPLTVAIKGFNAGLRDSSEMVRSVDVEVKT